jgi:squalene-associated FAD-dependent desaturase
MASQQISIIGGGWAGLAAAVAACEAGHRVNLYEASSSLGGRARSLAQTVNKLPLDNGQHILIGAYSATLGLMQSVGLDPNALLLRLPLDVRFADQRGLSLPNWPAPLHALWGILNASGWSALDKWSLLKTCLAWQIKGFTCPPTWSVADLMHHHGLCERAVNELIEPLCLSALNTPMAQASAAVFLRVLSDALMGGPGSSDLLIPQVDLHQLLPQACEAWLSERGAKVHLSQRISADDLKSEAFIPSPQHSVILATPAWEAARLTANFNPTWSAQAHAMSHLPIATVYVRCSDVGFKGLSRPMVALHSQADRPAQFVFCRTQLTQQDGVLACVISACDTERAVLETQVLQQLQEQVGLQQLEVLQTVVEKRAAFACTPHLQRPASAVAPHVWACGDYVAGPYPATLEGAVRSGLQVVAQL